MAGPERSYFFEEVARIQPQYNGPCWFNRGSKECKELLRQRRDSGWQPSAVQSVWLDQSDLTLEEIERIVLEHDGPCRDRSGSKECAEFMRQLRDRGWPKGTSRLVETDDVISTAPSPAVATAIQNAVVPIPTGTPSLRVALPEAISAPKLWLGTLVVWTHDFIVALGLLVVIAWLLLRRRRIVKQVKISEQV